VLPEGEAEAGLHAGNEVHIQGARVVGSGVPARAAESELEHSALITAIP